MRFALIGQPNCGKSTLFNQVAGYKAETGNFSGTTVTFTESKVRVLGDVVQLVDLPGTYTFTGTNPAEREAFTYLASHDIDAIINVVDASRLSLGLELTLELLELGKPIVIALNMMDEALRTGLTVDGPHLSKLLGVPVLPLIASRGRGVREVFTTALRVAQAHKTHPRLPYSPEVEQVIQSLSSQIKELLHTITADSAAIKLLEGDDIILEKLGFNNPAVVQQASLSRAALTEHRGQEMVWILSGERHARANQLAQGVLVQGERRMTMRDRLDELLLHPVLGYFFLVLILYIFFQFVYTFGSLLEKPLLTLFDEFINLVHQWLQPGTLWGELATGIIQGISGGVAIVLPYLAPFLIGLGLLEDIGYLPRIAFMMDALMHRLGLHGKAIVPFILGYGCNVPAIMSTRILEDRRDRWLAAALATLVPCAARLSVVFGLVAFYLGPNLALLIYLFNLFVIALTAKILTRLLPEDSPGLILEIPVYRLPTLKSVLTKAWFRIREFIVEAWPVLIAGSVVLSLLNVLNWTDFFNSLFTPFSWLLGLPKQVGVPLIFGILRKELSLVMLHQAMGGVEISTMLTSVQMVTFSVFVVFYIPCLATLMALRKELGTRDMLIIAAMTIVIATLAALLARFASVIFAVQMI